MNKILLFLFTLISMFPFIPISANASALQTQMSLDANFEIDVKKAQVIDNVLTVILVFRNTSGEKAKISMPPGQIHYIDAAQNKKYHILKDEKNAYILAPPLYYGNLEFEVSANGKKLAWFKMPAPDEGVDTINLNLPGSTPFEQLKISR